LAGYLLFLLALFLIVLLLAEFLILPWRNRPIPRTIQLMGFHAPPNTLIGDTPTNALGFTGDHLEPQKPAGALRLLTLGGSTMFNRRMTDRLAERLRASTHRPVEVLGAALRAHTTASSVLKFEALAPYRFDCVIICHGINDLFANHVPKELFSEDYAHINPWYHRGAVVDRSLAARVLYNGFRRPDSIATIFPGPFAENGAGFASEAVFERNLRRLIESIRGRGAVPVLLTFPSAIPEHYTLKGFWDFQLGYNNPTRYDPCPAEVWGSKDNVQEGLRRHNAVTRRLAAEYQVLLLDQETLMGSDLESFSDVCHFSESGTDRFIGHLVDFLLQEKILDP
jgi:hypothetical protein